MNQNTRPLPYHFISQDKPLDVVLVGAGGNGSEFFSGLMRLHQGMIALGGVGLSVTVFDDDTVSPSNIVRQRFWPQEVSLNKADALVHRTNMLMGTTWNSVPRRFEPSRDRSGSLLVTAVDNVATRQAVALTECLGNPLWLDMGCEGARGQVVLGKHTHSSLNDEFPNVTAHFPSLMSQKDDNKPSCSAEESLQRQDLMINASVAGAAINLLWRSFRSGCIPYNGVMLDLEASHVQAIPFLPEVRDGDRHSKDEII